MSSQRTPIVIPPNARCVGCGYSLYQLEVDRCPECGRGFDRHDPASMGIKPLRRSWIIRRLDRPHSRFTLVLPWAIFAAVLIGPVIPYALGFVVPAALVLWALMLAVQIPAMIARRQLARRGFFSPEQIQADQRLLWRMVKALSGCVLLILFFPIFAVIAFFVFQPQLNALAAYVPDSPVSYREFGAWRIGPFPLDGIDRTPHELDIGIIPQSVTDPSHPPFATGVVFILEDDPGYAYDNFCRLRLRGRWYVEYRF